MTQAERYTIALSELINNAHRLRAIVYGRTDLDNIQTIRLLTDAAVHIAESTPQFAEYLDPDEPDDEQDEEVGVYLLRADLANVSNDIRHIMNDVKGE